MSDSTADIEKRITAACDTIRIVWPVMHQHGSSSIAGKPTPKALYTHDDEDDATDDLGRLDIVVSLRHEVTGLLNSWARVVVEEHDLTHHLPDGGVCRHPIPGTEPPLWTRTLATVAIDPVHRTLDVHENGPCGHRLAPVEETV